MNPFFEIIPQPIMADKDIISFKVHKNYVFVHTMNVLLFLQYLLS